MNARWVGRRAVDFVHDKYRDMTVEIVVAYMYAFNSDKVDEATVENYPELDLMVSQLAQDADIEKPMVFVMTNRVPFVGGKLNAFAVGNKGHSAVFVGSELMKKLSSDELKGIVAHEITHIQKNHVVKQQVFRAISAMVTAYCVWSLSKRVYKNVQSSLENVSIDVQSFGNQINIPQLGEHQEVINKGIRVLGAFFVANIAKSLMSASLAPVVSASRAYYSRKCEFEADKGAVELTKETKIADGLNRLDSEMKRLFPFSTWLDSIWPVWFRSHPKTPDRVKNIEKVAQEIL
jgi:Zn-dependent protease with chaperone function